MFDSREIGLRLTEKRRMRLCKAVRGSEHQTLPGCDSAATRGTNEQLIVLIHARETLTWTDRAYDRITARTVVRCR